MTRPEPLDDPLITTFGRLVEATHGLERRFGAEVAESVDIPFTWFEVLLRLSRSDASRLSMGELSRQLALTSGGVTRVIDRMTDAGLVDRLAGTDDRRVQYAVVTRRGQALMRRAVVQHVASLHDVFAGFSLTELRTLDSLLDRLRELE